MKVLYVEVDVEICSKPMKNRLLRLHVSLHGAICFDFQTSKTNRSMELNVEFFSFSVLWRDIIFRFTNESNLLLFALFKNKETNESNILL